MSTRMNTVKKLREHHANLKLYYKKEVEFHQWMNFVDIFL